MSESNAFSHLTLEERRIILTGIVNGSTKTANVLLTVSAPWIVLSLSLSTVQDVTVLPVPATAVPTGLIADLINTSIVQRMPRWITAPPSLIPEKA